MALQTLQYVASIPAGTPSSAPFVEECDMDNWEVESIDLEVSVGPSGLMGFAIFNNNAQYLPRTPGAWFVWDNQQQTIYPTDYPNASGWAIYGYNTGQFPHAVTVRFHVNPPEQPPAPDVPIPTFTVASSSSEQVIV
jgi:hypothetical protein